MRPKPTCRHHNTNSTQRSQCSFEKKRRTKSRCCILPGSSSPLASAKRLQSFSLCGIPASPFGPGPRSRFCAGLFHRRIFLDILGVFPDNEVLTPRHVVVTGHGATIPGAVLPGREACACFVTAAACCGRGISRLGLRWRVQRIPNDRGGRRGHRRCTGPRRLDRAHH